ncbi:response regulator transcription factor [Enterococcus avium]|uniref:response regulator transcription factor n=1 Tax=Enterococcus avium TaxID=33945 RepID=UPI00288D2524|nr:response regulator transcription factor [Enterococcus avium]MDT2433927.1 response regulator transcription factor [Enterococcus avium]MDT2464342.1 response regulator transcription factor [Enterococcus avium]MDT2503871.1 response regulator transcription factor [Enterococcus avium]
MKKPVILIVEDEESLVSFIAEELKYENYEVLIAVDGQEALTLFDANEERVNLLLLDWMLPKVDGLTVARKIRRRSQVPILMMTARDQVVDKVSGLDAGVDDYLTKPFDIEELLARIRVILRREERIQSLQNEPIINQYQDLTMDVVKRTVTRDGQTIMLTQKEFDLLYELMKKPEEVFTRDELLNEVWGYDYIGQINTVDVFVRALRNKLDDDQHPRLIQTIRGVGYVLRADDEK